MSALLSTVLPSVVVTAEMYSDPVDLVPLPEEEPLIARSVAKRRNEFITVRHCAREALGKLGVGPVPILKGEKGEPCWPSGIVGYVIRKRVPYLVSLRGSDVPGYNRRLRLLDPLLNRLLA